MFKIQPGFRYPESSGSQIQIHSVKFRGEVAGQRRAIAVIIMDV